MLREAPSRKKKQGKKVKFFLSKVKYDVLTKSKKKKIRGKKKWTWRGKKENGGGKKPKRYNQNQN